MNRSSFPSLTTILQSQDNDVNSLRQPVFSGTSYFAAAGQGNQDHVTTISKIIKLNLNKCLLDTTINIYQSSGPNL